LVVRLTWIVVVEYELISSISVVNDCVVQTLQNSFEHSKSSSGLFLDWDNLCDFTLNIHRFAELELEFVLEVIDILWYSIS
jgi:hypothetical protein